MPWSIFGFQHVTTPDTPPSHQQRTPKNQGRGIIVVLFFLFWSAFGFLAFWLLGFLAFWLIGFLASWLVGFLASWLFGFLASWLFGFSAFRLFAGLCGFWWFFGFGFSHPLLSQFLSGLFGFCTLSLVASRIISITTTLFESSLLRTSWGDPPQITRYCLDCLQSNCTPI